MPEVAEVTITNGVPTAGSGTVPTLAPIRDQLLLLASETTLAGAVNISSDATTAVTVGTGSYTTLATISNTKYTLLVFQFAVATQALTKCQILAKGHASADLQTFGETAKSWTDPDAADSNIAAGSRILATNGNLDTVAAGSSGYFEMDITGLTSIVVQLEAAVNSASVTPRWTLHR